MPPAAILRVGATDVAHEGGASLKAFRRGVIVAVDIDQDRSIALEEPALLTVACPSRSHPCLKLVPNADSFVLPFMSRFVKINMRSPSVGARILSVVNTPGTAENVD